MRIIDRSSCIGHASRRMMRSFTSRNDRAKSSASYTTSAGDTIRMRITKPPTTSTPRPTSTCKAPNTATDKPKSSTKSKAASMMKVSKLSKRRPTTGRDSDGPLSFASTPHSGTSAAASSPLARPPMERVDSLDLISLQKTPEEGNIRLSDLSLSSLSQGRSPQDSNHKSHRGSTGTATTVSSDFTFSAKSLQSTGDHSACGTFRGITTTESTDDNIISSKSKFPPRRSGGSLSILRPVASTALTAYDTDLDQTTRSNASCPCDLGRRNSVRFGQVEILEFQRVIGDNPSCASGGPPISLGGTKPLSSQSIGLDDYEIHRTTNRRKREEMMVPPKLREVRTVEPRKIIRCVVIFIYLESFSSTLHTSCPQISILFSTCMHHRNGYEMPGMDPLRFTIAFAEPPSSSSKGRRAPEPAPLFTNYPNDSRP